VIPLRARKIARDLVAARGRVVVMILALAISTGAVGAVLGARAILERESRASYLSTNPASATLQIPGGTDERALRIVRSRPGVIDAALRAKTGARMVLPNGRRAPMLLFVAPASDPMRVASFRVEQGRWPPADDAMLLERSSLAYFGVHVGDRVALEIRAPHPLPDSPRGSRSPTAAPLSDTVTKTARIAGAVHDGSVAPTTQEGVAYGYATSALLSRFGARAMLDELKIIVGDTGGGHTSEDGRHSSADGGHSSADVARIDAVAEDVGTALRARGVQVARIDAPPPLRHPHQAQTDTATGMLLTFAILALVLGAMLAATMLGGMLSQQIRQIGVMRTLGASNGTLFGMYLLMTAAVATVAALLSLVPAVFAARYLASVVAGLFGIEIASFAVPWTVFATALGTGVLVPIAVAYGPLVRGTSVTVREAIDGGAPAALAFGTLSVQRRLARWSGGGPALRLALRNVLRHPGRLALVVMLLGASGAVFVAARGTADGLQAAVDQGMSHRRYDLDVRLSRTEDGSDVTRALAGAGGVAALETSVSAPATIPHAGGIEVTRTYPDGGHGSFALAVLRPGSAFVQLPLVRGRALRDDEADAVVFNQLVIPQQARRARLGDQVAIAVNGRIARYRLVGIVSDVGSPATAYVTASGFARAGGEPGFAHGERAPVSLVRVVTNAHDAPSRAAAAGAIRQRLAAAGIAVRAIVPIGQYKLALNGHAAAIAQTLGAIAVIMAIVGIFGVGSALGSGVMERTRELGVLRSLGASSRTVAAMVVLEGLLYGAASALAAVLLSIPLTIMLDRFIGMQALLVPLPFVFPAQAVVLTCTAGLAAAASASAAAARTAARITIRDALAAF
jgi:putative ABC transport system permease protein